MQKSAISIMKKMAVLLLTAGIGFSMAGWDGKSKETAPRARARSTRNSPHP